MPIGRGRTVRHGRDITLVGWGNTVRLCEQAAASLAEAGAQAEVIDLRCLVPWDQEAVIASAERTGRLLVAHEDNQTAGMGAEVVATVAERSRHAIRARRVTRADTYVPCNFGNQLEVLPSYKRVLETAVELLGGNIAWRMDSTAQNGSHTIDAIGSSPSDESVTVIEWRIKPGDKLEHGMMIAELEADKAAFDFKSPSDGIVEEILCQEGDTVPVGTPIARVRSLDQMHVVKPVTRENPGTPIIDGIASQAHLDRDSQNAASAGAGAGTELETAVIAGITSALGGRTVTNREIAENCPAWEPQDIVKRTGIRTRRWATADQSALSLAVDASRSLLDQFGMTIDQVDMLICSTGTPPVTTPALATLIHHQLSGESPQPLAAFDINAACSGYVYGIKIAADHIALHPQETVLLVTTEVLSRKLDLTDADTAPVFGDAATASLIMGRSRAASSGGYEIVSTALGAIGEPGDALRVPVEQEGRIFMDGPKVFQQAVRSMVDILIEAAESAGIAVSALDLVVPHQANQRIINAVRQRLKAPTDRVYSNIAERGNTSSSTIPLALEELMSQTRPAATIGLTAFGGGYTFAGAVVKST